MRVKANKIAEQNVIKNSAIRDRFSYELATVVGLAIGVAGISSLPLWRLTRPVVLNSDILVHAAMSVSIVESGFALSYCVWYPLIYFFSGGGNPDLFRIASVLLLSGFVAAKAVLIYLIFRHERVDVWTSTAVAFGLSFAAPWVDPNAPADIYLGQVSATIWHNSTNIVAAPFALAAFWFFIKLLNRPQTNVAWIAGASIVFSIFAKPNFALAFLPVAGLSLLLVLAKSRSGLVKSVSILMITFLPAVAVLIAQYVIVYGSERQSSGGVEVNPFLVWNIFSDNHILSLALSLSAVAVAFTVLVATRFMKIGTRVSLVVLLLAVAQFILLSESAVSGRTGDGNWFWGAHTSLLIVFVWLILDLRVLALKGGTVRDRWWAVAAILGVATHAVSGLYYALTVGTASYGFSY